VQQTTVHIIGWVFISLAFILVLATFHDSLTRWANKIDIVFRGGLLFATMVILVKTLVDAAKSSALFITISIFVFLLPVAFIYYVLRQIRVQQKKLGANTALVLTLRVISGTMSMFAGVLLLLRVSDAGNPIGYLAAGLFSLSLASLLEHSAWNQKGAEENDNQE
jgi:hypothetical protein